MKRLLILFGALDIITVAKAYKSIYRMIFETSEFHWISLVNILIYVSLLVSGYYLIKQNKLGLWISYAQFPLRLLFAFFSFGFLMILNRLFDGQTIGIQILSGFLLILEIGRLILSIMIHRKYYR